MKSLALQMIGAAFAEGLRSAGINHIRLDGAYRRVDAAVATAFVAQQLEYVKAETFDIAKVALKARTLFDVTHETPPGAEVVAYDQYDTMGEAKLIANYAKDYPRVDAEMTRHRDVIAGYGASYGYSTQDMRAIAMSGSRLNTHRAMQGRRAHEAVLERVAAIGIPQLGKTGAVNDANINLFFSALTWTESSVDPKTIYRALMALAQSVWLNSNQVWQADTLLMAPKPFAIASAVAYSDTIPDSVLTVFLRQNPFGIKQADQWLPLQGAGADGVKDRIMVYKRSKDVIEVDIPLEYTELAPQMEAGEVVIYSESRTGGAIVRQPLACAYADGTFNAAA